MPMRSRYEAKRLSQYWHRPDPRRVPQALRPKVRHLPFTGSAEHVPGSCSVAHEDVADAAVEQRIVRRQDAATGKAEHDFGVFHLQRLDQGLGPGDLHGYSLIACD